MDCDGRQTGKKTVEIHLGIPVPALDDRIHADSDFTDHWRNPRPGFHNRLSHRPGSRPANSRWAKKRYVDFKRRFPNYGKWTDWAMRRRHHKTLPDDFELPIFGKVKTGNRGKKV